MYATNQGKEFSKLSHTSFHRNVHFIRVLNLTYLSCFFFFFFQILFFRRSTLLKFVQPPRHYVLFQLALIRRKELVTRLSVYETISNHFCVLYQDIAIKLVIPNTEFLRQKMLGSLVIASKSKFYFKFKKIPDK